MMRNSLDLEYVRLRNVALLEQGAHERRRNSVKAERPSRFGRVSRALYQATARFGRRRLDGRTAIVPGSAGK